MRNTSLLSCCSFNSRLREEATVHQVFFVPRLAVSTHASVRRRLPLAFFGVKPFSVSTHASVRRRRGGDI